MVGARKIGRGDLRNARKNERENHNMGHGIRYMDILIPICMLDSR